MGVLEQNRKRERSEKKQKTFFTTDQPYGIDAVGWKSRERKSERDWVWKRLLLAYPAWFCPGLDPTSSHVSEAADVQCYPDVRKRGKKDHNIPIIRSAFLTHAHTQSQVHVVARQLSKHLHSLSSTLATPATPLNSFWGAEEREGGR